MAIKSRKWCNLKSAIDSFNDEIIIPFCVIIIIMVKWQLMPKPERIRIKWISNRFVVVGLFSVFFSYCIIHISWFIALKFPSRFIWRQIRCHTHTHMWYNFEFYQNDNSLFKGGKGSRRVTSEWHEYFFILEAFVQ